MRLLSGLRKKEKNVTGRDWSVLREDNIVGLPFTDYELKKMEERKQEIATIQVRDIKEYLVDEYKRSQGLLERNKSLEKLLEEAEELKLKYDATLVTLDEFRQRLDRQEKIIADKDKKIADLKESMAVLRDETNTYKIQLSRIGIQKDEIRDVVVTEVTGEIVKRVTALKGNLNKDRVVKAICEETKDE